MSFHRFAELPFELRLEIWKHLIPGPRIIKIIAKKKRMWHLKKGGRLDSNEVLHKIRQELPVLLHICFESRQVALEIYKVFQGNFFDGQCGYIDYSNDYLYWSTATAFKRTMWAHFVDRTHRRPGIECLLNQARFVMIRGRDLDPATCSILPHFRKLNAVFFQLNSFAAGYMGSHWKSAVKSWVRVGSQSQRPDAKVPEVFFMNTVDIKYSPQPMEDAEWWIEPCGLITVVPKPKPKLANRVLVGMRHLLQL